MDTPTDKQKRFIAKVSQLIGVPFTGTTFKDACEYLDKYKAQYDALPEEVKHPVAIATPKQLKLINTMSKALGVEFTGKNIKEASAFITQYKPQYDALPEEVRFPPKPATTKQLDCIYFVERMLDIRFMGSTLKEASEFLDEYYQEAVKVQKQYKR